MAPKRTLFVPATRIQPRPRRSPAGGLLGAGLIVALLAASCTTGGGARPAGKESPAPGTSSPPIRALNRSGCGSAEQPGPPDGPSAKATVLSDAKDEPKVKAVVYPRPDYAGKPWSQWGQGLVLPDGTFISAIGDQHGADGNSFIYVYDPSTSRLTQIADVLSLVDHKPGSWGFGKVHAAIVAGRCGDAYLATYWGSRRGLAYESGYDGDLLFRFDTESRSFTRLGTPVPRHGIPSMAGFPERGLLYGEAVDPNAEPKGGAFFVYDTSSEKVVFRNSDVPHVGFRNVMVGPDGVAYFSAGEGRLWAYDPGRKRMRQHEAQLPGAWLRASTVPGPDGSVYGATREPDMLFALRPSGKIETLGPARGYVASLALDPSGKYLYYVPEAHGKSYEQGTPLVRVDTRTGKEEVVVKLNDLAEERLGLRLGGSYNVAVDPSGERVYIGMNAGKDGESFGEVVLLVVDLP